MTVDVEDFNYGKSGAAAMIGLSAGKAKMKRTATIKDNNGITIAILELKKVQANPSFDNKKGIRSLAYLEFVVELQKIIKKCK